MIKRVVHIDTKTRAIKPMFVDLDKFNTRCELCETDQPVEIPFGGNIYVLIDELAVYRAEQTWCSVGVFPLPFGGKLVFFQKDEEDNVSDFMRTEAFFREFITWLAPQEAQAFLIAKNVVAPQAFGTLGKPKVKAEASHLRVVK